jgi:small subunit ribosomal protein S6e
MGQEINGEHLGDDYKGYIFRITGGNDKQGFTMKQGILVQGRSRILFRKRKWPAKISQFTCLFFAIYLIIILTRRFLSLEGTTYRPRRTGERKRKSVRGCITGPDLSVIALRVVKKGDKDIAGCNDAERPNRLGRKRRMRIVSAFALDKKLDNVCKYVVHRKIEKGDKTYYKAPHIQRMVSEKRIRRKMALKRSKINAVKASCDAAKTYEKLLKEYGAEKRAAREKEHAEKAAWDPSDLAAGLLHYSEVTVNRTTSVHVSTIF